VKLTKAQRVALARARSNVATPDWHDLALGFTTVRYLRALGFLIGGFYVDMGRSVDWRITDAGISALDDDVDIEAAAACAALAEATRDDDGGA
jgi:hypothetical protein